MAATVKLQRNINFNLIIFIHLLVSVHVGFHIAISSGRVFMKRLS
jgi:hypothetical protein